MKSVFPILIIIVLTRRGIAKVVQDGGQEAPLDGKISPEISFYQLNNETGLSFDSTGDNLLVDSSVQIFETWDVERSDKAEANKDEHKDLDSVTQPSNTHRFHTSSIPPGENIETTDLFTSKVELTTDVNPVHPIERPFTKPNRSPESPVSSTASVEQSTPTSILSLRQSTLAESTFSTTLSASILSEYIPPSPHLTFIPVETHTPATNEPTARVIDNIGVPSTAPLSVTPVSEEVVSIGSSQISRSILEKTINDIVEGLLKKKLADDQSQERKSSIDPKFETLSSSHIANTPPTSTTVSPLETTLSLNNEVTSTQSEIPLPTSIINPFQELLDSTHQLPDNFEDQIKNGIDEPNYHRLENILKAILKIDEQIKPSLVEQQEANDNMVSSKSLSQEDIGVSEIITTPAANDIASFEDLKADFEIVGEAFEKLNNVETLGLDDKSNKEIRKAQYHWSRLKDIPEDVLDILFSKDKRQKFDNIKHGPFLEKIALDVTQHNDGDGDPKLNETTIKFDSKSGNIDSTHQNSEDLNKADINHQDEVAVEQHGGKLGQNLKKLLNNENSKKDIGDINDRVDLVPDSPTTYQDSDYQSLQDSKVNFVFDKQRKNLRSKTSIKNGKVDIEFDDPESKLFGKQSIDDDTEDKQGHDKLNDGKLSSKKGNGTNIDKTISDNKRNKDDQKSNNSEQSSESFLDKLKKNPSLLFVNDGKNDKKEKIGEKKKPSSKQDNVKPIFGGGFGEPGESGTIGKHDTLLETNLLGAIVMLIFAILMI